MFSDIERRRKSIVRLVRNIAFDLNYGGFSGGSVQNRYPGATTVGNTDYETMAQIFDGRIRPDDVLVEVGCGKGRVINWWLSRGLSNRIVGLEIMEEIAAQTRRRLRRFRNVEIRDGDALAQIPDEGTLFYLFNPFNAEVMRRFEAAMRDHCARRAGVRILYYACIHLDVFRDDPRWEIDEVAINKPSAGKFEDRHAKLAVIRFRGGAPEVRPDLEEI